MSTAPFPRSGNWYDNISDLPIWRFTVEEYHEMVRTGILQPGSPIELLEGLLVTQMIKKRPHELSTGCTYDCLVKLAGPDWHVMNQSPITTDDSEPEPDIAVVRGARRDYPDRHPHPEDIGLVVEVADTSLEQDRGQKKRIYAASGIDVYWIVNLHDRCVEVFTQPTGRTNLPSFLASKVYRGGDQIPVSLAGLDVGQIAVDDLLP